jgi:hypothetical protein
MGIAPLSSATRALGASGDAGSGSRKPSRKRRLGPPGFDPSRKIYGTPRRGQSVPRAAFGVAMLTLLRLPF